MDQYELCFEENAGKGIADCIMIPRKKGLPGIVIELKYNGSTDEALRQIEERKYVKRFAIDVGHIIAVGINYNKKTKRHECKIADIVR